jgi:hypothetical protein
MNDTVQIDFPTSQIGDWQPGFEEIAGAEYSAFKNARMMEIEYAARNHYPYYDGYYGDEPKYLREDRRANILADLHFVQWADEQYSRHLDMAKIIKQKNRRGFLKIYSVEYDDVLRMRPHIPYSVLEVLNIWSNATFLNRWNELEGDSWSGWPWPSTEEIEKRAARRQLVKKCENLRDRWVKWMKGAQDKMDLQEIGRGCKEVVNEYREIRY